MDKEKNWLDYFYYAAPLWLALETFIWPGFRAGAITGGNGWGNLAFYTMEGGLGAALYLRLPLARPAALLESAVQLIFVLRLILLNPLDMAMDIENLSPGAAAAHTAALPGALYSAAYIVFRIKSEIRRFGKPSL